MDNKNSFLGVGWAFPPHFDEINKEVAMVSKAEDILQSLNILLSTRPWRTNYESNIWLQSKSIYV